VQPIPVILLKSLTVNNLMYSSDVPRTSNGIDLLVKKAHWLPAVAAVTTIMQPLIRTEKAVFDDLYKSSFVPKSQLGAALDLHMSFIHPCLFAIEQDALWRDNVIHHSFDDTNVRMLSPDQALIHQVMHAFKYNLLDSHELINTLKLYFAHSNCIEITKAWRASVACYCLLKTVMM
jgi:hypothetical protein